MWLNVDVQVIYGCYVQHHRRDELPESGIRPVHLIDGGIVCWQTGMENVLIADETDDAHPAVSAACVQAQHHVGPLPMSTGACTQAHTQGSSTPCEEACI